MDRQLSSPQETGFRIQKKIATGSWVTLIDKTAGSTTHTDSSLASNTFTYRVIALGTPNSAPSNERVVIIRNLEADSYVHATNTTTNYGTATILEVKNYSTNTREAFVRFTLTDVAATVSSAKVRLYGNSVVSAKSIALSAVTDITWGETTIIYTNKPTIGTQQTSMSVGITAAWVEFDVTSYVQAQKTAGATKITLAVTMVPSVNETQTTFNSQNNTTNKPLVVISSTP